MKVRDLLRTLAKDSWTLKNQEGSHRQFIHPAKPGKITVSGHPSDEVPVGTLKAILKQAGLK
jgi:predicted RNA binding protein YcfA (HicA-like mRNA interferase family)